MKQPLSFETDGVKTKQPLLFETDGVKTASLVRWMGRDKAASLVRDGGGEGA